MDLVYTNIKKTFKAVPRPHLGSSDHLSVMLISAYEPLLTREKLEEEESEARGSDVCFERADWSMFREAASDNHHTDVGEYVASVSGYIQWCMEQVTVTQTIVTRANQKPWMAKEVRDRLREHNAAFKSGDATALRSARANLNRAIRVAKRVHSQKIQGLFQDPNNTRQLWQGIQTVTDYKARMTSASSMSSITSLEGLKLSIAILRGKPCGEP